MAASQALPGCATDQSHSAAGNGVEIHGIVDGLKPGGLPSGGEFEAGGTQVLMLAGVPFEKLGMPDLPERSYASISETVQHTIYKGAMAPTALFAGLLWLARRSTKIEQEKEGGES